VVNAVQWTCSTRLSGRLLPKRPMQFLNTGQS